VKKNKIFRFNFSPFYRCGANLVGAHFVIPSMNSSSRSLSMNSIKTFRDGNMGYAAVGEGKRKFTRHFDV
jgi:hypothetical protein